MIEPTRTPSAIEQIRHGELDPLKNSAPTSVTPLPPPRADTYVATPSDHIVEQAMARIVADGANPHSGPSDLVTLRANMGTPPHAPMVKRIIARVEQGAKTGFARYVYHPSLQTGRHILRHGAAFLNSYAGQQPTEYGRKFRTLEILHETGDFKGAYGHATGTTPIVLSKVISTRSLVQTGLGEQRAAIGHDMVLASGQVIPIAKAQMSLMIGTSGMSFPQLSARSVLTLMYANAACAEKGVRYLVNTGEGGPDMHLALLTGDSEGLRQLVLSHAINTGEIKAESINHARVEETVRRLMSERDALFANLGPDAVKNAQVTAQFGSAFNGIRNAEGGVDFAKLEHVGKHPNVAMIEFKLKQAAKRGSKVDMSKMDHIAASIREVSQGQKFKSPPLNPEVDSYEDIATLVIATKLLTGKPVSLKFGVGDVENIHEFFAYLSECGALPDHIQIDGAGKFISPGSGNAPPTGAAGDSSLTAREGLIAVDTVLKHLGVRDNIFVSMAGEVMLPSDAVEAMALGADATLGARTWMAMGLGCAGVRSCDGGSCPYGITETRVRFRGGSEPFGYRTTRRRSRARLARALARRNDRNRQRRLAHTAQNTHGLHALESNVAIRKDGETHKLRYAYPARADPRSPRRRATPR